MCSEFGGKEDLTESFYITYIFKQPKGEQRQKVGQLFL